MGTRVTAAVDTPQRAVDAPFLDPADWHPIPGRCSACGGPALLGETRWWHENEPCPRRGKALADFLPD